MKYIIIPKHDYVSDVLAETDIRIDPNSKMQSFQELLKMRSDPGFRVPGTPSEFDDFPHVAREIVGQESTVNVLASPETGTVATGVTVIDTDEAGVDALRAELNQSTIVPNDTIELIESDVLAGGAIEDAADFADTDLWHLRAIGLEQARRNGFTGTGAGVRVAVLDTGIADVPELQGKVYRTIAFDSMLWKAVHQPNLEDTYRDYGHGTLVAGIIAGTNVGVAPGSQLDSAVLLPQGRSDLLKYILTLEWVASQQNINVVNMSAGKEGYHENMRLITRILRRLNTITFVAIGNEGPDTSRSPGNYPEVISVGASNDKRQIWGRSSGGELLLDHMSLNVPKLVAPGEGITSCVKGGGYKKSNGSSLATPILSGIACLMLERFPGIGLTDLEAELLAACEDLGFDSERQGRGEANLPPSLL